MADPDVKPDAVVRSNLNAYDYAELVQLTTQVGVCTRRQAVIDATLVTIHGFWSSPATWERLTDVWRVDEELRGLRIHAFGYPSPKKPRLPFSVTRVPDYDDIAQTLATEYATVLADASDIAVVTHSQGGLILQRFLTWMVSEGRARELGRIRSVVMLACPNGGSEYLESVRRTLGYGRHPQARSLQVLDRQVADTQRTVLQRIVHATTVDDYQCRIPFHVYAGGSDDIVKAASAQAAFPGASTIAGNHFTILHPAAKGNRTAETVKRHMLADITAQRAHPGAVPALEITGEPEPPAGFREQADSPPTHLAANIEGSQQINIYDDTASNIGRGWRQYRENILDIAPSGGLLDRDPELAELSDFCSSEHSYLWWQAGAWAGKSALMSWFALNPPPGVVPVCFFVTARYASQSDSSAFLVNVVPQLEELSTLNHHKIGSEPQRIAVYNSLLREAAHAAEEQGRRLVLIIDGLDEDRGTDLGMRSIASLLPRRCESGLKVIVASRPHPTIPRDVPQDHPLRLDAVRRQLTVSPHAQVIRDTAEIELQVLISGSNIQQDIIGFLSAAGGGLTASDLAELTEQTPFEIRTTLRGVSGRTFVERTPRWAEPGDVERVYLLAHEALQEEALRGIGSRRLHDYHHRLDKWADHYKSQDWPRNTPAYLLDDYFQMARRTGDFTRMVSCAVDGLRHDRMLARSGGDETAISEVNTAKSAILTQEDINLEVMLRLSLHGEELESRNALLPVELPAVWAYIGNADRAEALARSFKAPILRVRALAQVVSALIDVGQSDQASRIAVGTADIAYTIEDPEQKSRSLTEVAKAFAACGHPGEAIRHAAAAEDATEGIAATLWKASALANVALAMAASGRLDESKRIALKARIVAAAINWQSQDMEVLVAIATALVVAGLEQAAREFIQPISPGWKTAVFAEIAVAVAAIEPIQARRFVSHVEEIGASPATLADASVALVITGDLERAREMAIDSMRQAQTLDYEINRELALAKVTNSLAAAGLSDKALLVAEGIGDPELRSRALASVANNFARSGDIRRAEDVAIQAQAAAREDPGEVLMERLTWFVSALTRAKKTTLVERLIETGVDLAQQSSGSMITWELLEGIAEACATFGDYDRAELVARTITSPDILAQALAVLANVNTANGRSSAALPLIEEALHWLDSAVDDSRYIPQKNQALAKIALAFGRSNQADRARDIALRIESVDWLAWFICELIKSVPPTGDFQFIRSWMSEIERSAAAVQLHYVRDETLACLAESKAIMGAHSDAIGLARNIADPMPRSEALAKTSIELYRQGIPAESMPLIEEAEEAAGQIEDADEPVSALTSIAEALSYLGETARARRVIAKALASAPSRESLFSLAELAPEALAAAAFDLLAALAPKSAG